MSRPWINRKGLVMNFKRVEQLLREYARRIPPERLFSDESAAQFRARLSPSESESKAESEVSSEVVEPYAPAAARVGPRRRYRLAWTGIAAVAAVILVAVLTSVYHETSSLPGLTVDGAYDKASLFRTTRAAPPTPAERSDLFYVGVKVDQPAYVRIIALDNHGRLESLPLDRSGSLEQHVDADTETVFGGYEVESVDDSGVASTITEFIIIASTQPVETERLSGWIDRKNRTATGRSPLELDELAREISDRFRCAARYVPVLRG
jgi:hypothetical protein